MVRPTDDDKEILKPFLQEYGGFKGGFDLDVWELIQTFVAREREACAVIATELLVDGEREPSYDRKWWGNQIATAIRARAA